MRGHCRRHLAVALLVLGVPALAAGFELPPDVPTRNEGLWLMEQAGTISDGETTFEIRKIWHVCLDARADRALHELEIREQQASVASLNEICEEPRLTFQGNSLSWTMSCSGPSIIEDKIGKTDVRHTTSFLNDNETRAESIVINRDNLIHSDGRFVTHMQRLGACDGDFKPGDMMLRHWRVNGEETLKGRQLRSLFEEIATNKALTASRLDH